MVLDEIDEMISFEKMLNCDMENFCLVIEGQFEGVVLGEQVGEFGNLYSFLGEMYSEKDNNQLVGMSFQIFLNFIIWFSFYNL